MNAQEATGRLEELIGILTVRRDNYAHVSYEGNHAKEVPKLNRDIEALSIVLESTKYLHEEFVFREITEHFSGTKTIYLDTDFEEMKIITNEKARRMGIVEGADE